MSKEPIQPQDKYVLRLPDGMRERIKAAAEESNRSMNAEIVVRLQQSLDGAFLDMSAEGFVALIKRFEATVAAGEELYMKQRDSIEDLRRTLAEKQQ